MENGSIYIFEIPVGREMIKGILNLTRRAPYGATARLKG